MNISHDDFWQWWNTEGSENHSMISWGDHHTAVAIDYAKYQAKRIVRQTLDEALNSGNGSYVP